MSRIPAILITVTLALLSVGASAWTLGPEKRLEAFRPVPVEPGERVQSWSFAEDADGWNPRSDTVLMSFDATAGHDAPGCLRVKGYDDGNYNFVWSPRISVRPGAAYRASMWLRVEGMPAAAPPEYYFKVQMFLPEGRRGGALIGSSRIPNAITGEWRKLVVRFSVPEGGLDGVAFALEKGTRSRADVDVTIDDVIVEEISPAWARNVWRDAALRGPITGELKGVHPRLYLTAERITYLRQAIQTDPQWKRLFETLKKYADTAVRLPPPDYAEQMKNHRPGEPAGNHEQLWQRGVGNRIPNIALAYLLTDDPRYLEAAKTWVFTALDYPTWGIGRMAGLDLAAGHILTGVGLAYDWLYHDLTPEERERIREKVTPRAEKLAYGGFIEIPFWHKAYLQNHLWVSVGGVATMAFALADEVPEAASWICFAHDKFVQTLELLGDDGASHEGYGYWEYGAEYIMRYMELADTCLGINLYVDSDGIPQPWLFHNALYALHLALPDPMWTRKQSVVDLADCPRNHWYGPSYLLRNLARRFPDMPGRQSALWLANGFEAAGADATGGGHYLNFSWFDPDIPAVPPKEEGLPLWHHFEDMGIVSSRSSWEGKATLFIAKCGPPLGHAHAGESKDYGAGHVHPDAGHFILAAAGEILFRDSGYTDPKLTGNHSTVLINGQGQKGEGQTWFSYRDWVKDRRAPTIRSVSANADGQTIVCDLAPAYPGEAGLLRFDRTFTFDPSGRLTIQDVIETGTPAEIEWRFQVEGTLEKLSEMSWLTATGKVTARVQLNPSQPIKSSPGSLETNQHLHAAKQNYISVKTAGKTTAAHLTTIVKIDPEA